MRAACTRESQSVTVANYDKTGAKELGCRWDALGVGCRWDVFGIWMNRRIGLCAEYEDEAQIFGLLVALVHSLVHVLRLFSRLVKIMGRICLL